ncbi:hypothetical protein [Paenibacillus sp. GCM10027626]|uniref:hypothetical protein n=1 Tax=Paenibacillus sp. GCM10027626 TaxID=3273411 RepID=UPI00363202AB
MNWRKAKLYELRVILHDDKFASLADRQAAEAELVRRRKQRHARMQNKERKVYPR